MAQARPVNLGEGVRTYVANTSIKPDFSRAIGAGDRRTRKLMAADAMADAGEMAKLTLTSAFDKLKTQGLLTSYEFLPMTGAIVLNVPESKAGAAYDALRGVDHLSRIARNREVVLDDEVLAGDPPATQVEWNVGLVGATNAWKQGVTGAGVTVGVVDTGADVMHENLKSHFRGTQADGTVDYNYNFYDPVNGKTVAYDDHGHGTHTAGTAVGGTASRATGMAPGAKFISTKVFTAQGSGNTATILKGLNWMLAPTDSTGANPDPTKAPDIVSNSWGSSMGAKLDYMDAWKAFQAAGIVPVVSAGNSGPRPSTLGAPGSYPQSISVAATDSNDVIAPFSSRGPSPVKNPDGTESFKPDVAAPGVAVVSSVPGGGYKAMSGTSMAAPAVSGVTALLLSKYPTLTTEQIRDVLTRSSKDLGTPGRDYEYGAGRIDVVGALALAAQIAPPKSE